MLAEKFGGKQLILLTILVPHQYFQNDMALVSGKWVNLGSNESGFWAELYSIWHETSLFLLQNV